MVQRAEKTEPAPDANTDQEAVRTAPEPAGNTEPAGNSGQLDSTEDAFHNLEVFSNSAYNITKKEKLNDVVVNLAQKVLQSQFPDMKGFHDSVMGPRTFPVESGTFVQILHFKDHWIVVGGLENGQVDVYDSSSSGVLSSGFVNQINSLRGGLDAVTNLKSCQQQVNGYDCGVYAIANAYGICAGLSVRDLKYNRGKMREHLIACLRRREFSPFPLYPTLHS